MVIGALYLIFLANSKTAHTKPLIADRRGSWPLKELACTRRVCLARPAPWRAPELGRTCFAPPPRLASRNSASVAGQVGHRFFNPRSAPHPASFRPPGPIRAKRGLVGSK